MSNENKGVTVDFETQYDRVDNLLKSVAIACLKQVEKNDVRLLIKVGNRLETVLQEIKDIQ